MDRELPLRNVLLVILTFIPTQWLFSKVSSNSNILLWKFHRFFLKNTSIWHEIILMNKQSFRVKYYAEGKYLYVFKILGSNRLLKITQEEFYHKCDDVNAKRTEQSCLIMNQLAVEKLAPKCEYLGGSALIVDNAGPQITLEKINTRHCIIDFFSQLQNWSLKHGIVLLDFNENNWCFNDAQLLFVDIDFEKTCRLQEIRSNPTVKKRIDVKAYRDDIAAFAAFLNEEEQLLWNYLNQG